MYEYKVLKLATAEELEDTLNAYARDGWRCKFQYVVEGFGGFTTLVVTLERKVGAGEDCE
ncbi:hypothetical protein J2Z79_000901 [Symbiobacterium terraclitae]|uniref:DUF4177 domain-containing protein n=1 Tax=Symbiobacterium terraclitae TaxID=557451 RepID=A0ABS4JPP6_9FIRM|nr:hypothetical protein [Symbiobacterium terraclitae]